MKALQSRGLARVATIILLALFAVAAATSAREPAASPAAKPHEPDAVEVAATNAAADAAARANDLIATATPTLARVGQPIRLEAAGTSVRPDVNLRWDLAGPERPGVVEIADADKPVATATPRVPGMFSFSMSALATGGCDMAGVIVLPDPATERPPKYDGARVVRYKTARDGLGAQRNLYLHVFTPPGWTAADRRPVAMFFHDGGWVSGDASRTLPECRYFVSRGLITVSVEYRTRLGHGTKPEQCVADARSAVRFLRAHAAEWGADPHKVIAGGESVGAHLAASAATLPNYDDPADDRTVSCVPDALVLSFPWLRVNNRYGNGKDDFSPLDFVDAKTPPSLVIAGALNRFGPAELSIEWDRKLRAAGRTSRLVIYADARHPSARDPRVEINPFVNDSIRRTDQFLASLGYLTGAPTLPPPPDGKRPAVIEPKDFRPLPPLESEGT
jgi:acetyl esterase